MIGLYFIHCSIVGSFWWGVLWFWATSFSGLSSCYKCKGIFHRLESFGSLSEKIWEMTAQKGCSPSLGYPSSLQLLLCPAQIFCMLVMWVFLSMLVQRFYSKSSVNGTNPAPSSLEVKGPHYPNSRIFKVCLSLIEFTVCSCAETLTLVSVHFIFH